MVSESNGVLKLEFDGSLGGEGGNNEQNGTCESIDHRLEILVDKHSKDYIALSLSAFSFKDSVHTQKEM